MSQILAFLGVAAIVVMLVMWFVGLIGAIARKDLKEPKWMWIVLILLIGPAVYFYFFIENRKTQGWIAIIATILAIVLPILGVIVA